jgi:hypothetical protein
MSCQQCERMKMLISEVGLDPGRVCCIDDADGDGICILLCGTGDEGFSAEQVDDLTDRAIALSGWTRPEDGARD